MIILYDHPLSGNCYKVRLTLAHLGVEYERRNVDIFEGEQHQQRFVELNPAKKIPVFVDDDYVLWESNAILLYLGRKYAPNRIFSDDPSTFGLISQWLLYGKTTIDASLAPARYLSVFIPEEKRDHARLAELQSAGMNALSVLNGHLADNDWLAPSYSIADIGCFPYVSLAHEGGIDLTKYPNVNRWCDDIRSQDGFIPMDV